MIGEILMLLDIKSIMKFSECCKAINNLLTQGLWKKLIARDFPNSQLNWEVSTKQTYASLFKQKTGCQNTEVKLQNKIEDLEDKLNKCSTTLKTKEQELDEILKPEGTRVAPIAEKAFTIIYRQKVAASKDGYVYANKQHGKPTRLMHIPIAVSGSSTASNSCIRKRSQVVEKVLSDISGPTKNHSLPSDKVTQNASLINRNREMFVESAKEAGIKLVSKFDIKDVAALKAELPWEQIRMLKRAFDETFGFDVFGSEKMLREYVGKPEIPFESGTFTTQGGKTVNFVCVVNVKEVIEQMVEELIESNSLKSPENINENTLYITLLGDKGGTSTKLLLQVLNTNDSLVHSNRAAKMIAIYEGDKESRECIEAIFSNLIRQIQDTCENIKELHLKSHKVCPQMSHIQLINVPPSDTKLSVKGASKCPPEIVHVDTTNLYFSQNCSLCRDQANASNIPIYNTSETADSRTHSEKENKCHCEFDDCILVLGGDWAWIASILGYTGPNGVHFCKDCLCRLSDLQKGATHTPNPLPKYKDFVPQSNRFGVRTFEQLRADHLKYKDSGEPRSKVKNFNNCEFSSLFRGTGPVILKTSCMRLFTSHWGLGLRY